MSRLSLRPLLAPLAGAAICLMAAPHPGATERGGIIEQFVGRSVSVSGPEAGGPIEILIHRWSTDQDLDRLRGVLADNAADNDKLFPSLQTLRLQPAGVLLMPGVQARGVGAHVPTPRNLLFAREMMTPTGRRIIAASEAHLGLGEAPLEALKTIEEFSLLDIRFGPDGTGIGKVAGALDVVYNPATMTFEVRDYETKPVRLVDVKAETR